MAYPIPQGAQPAISHPYPPTYRITTTTEQGQGQPGRLHRSGSDSSSISPHEPLVHPHSRALPDLENQDVVEKLDARGIPLPVGWTKEDEEAERAFLKKGMVDWKTVGNWRFWIRKEWWAYYLALIILGVLVVLMTVFHDQIVDWLTPAANWMKDLPAGWTIPIAVLFVLSFPPLFGQEIVAILVGVVWGLWIGFGIVAAGTFLGEFGNYYAFKYCLRSTAEKYERKNLNYACMAHVVREGGFWIVFMARLSAIPGHFTTAVFATCGTGIWVFSIATILTLPKQLVVVYLGVIFKESGDGQTTGKKDKIISYTVLAVGFLVTVYAAWYIYHKMRRARVIVWRRRRMEAAAKGVSANPTAGDIGNYKEYVEMAEQDEEAREGMLAKPNGQAGSLYPNPYNARYESRDNMSLYSLPDTLLSQQPQRLREEDISSGHPYYPSNPAQGGFGFPTARPHLSSGSGSEPGLRREATQISTYDYSAQSEPAVFPVAVASPATPTATGGGRSLPPGAAQR